MQSTVKLMIAAVLLTASPAMARQTFSIAGNIPATDYPGAPKPVSDSKPAPYAMNYSEEVAENLGLRNGQMSVFSTQLGENQPYMPSFSGGLGSEGAMLKLQWHPGE